MNICKTDCEQLIRILNHSEQFYTKHAQTTRELDEIRKIRKMRIKLERRMAELVDANQDVR